MNIKEKWVAWEEILPGFSPATNVNFEQVGGLQPGSIPFGDATGFLTEDNPNLFWDAANIRLGIGTLAPATAFHIEFPAVAVVESRLSAKTRPWRQWECIDGNWGLAIGIHADDGKMHFNYDSPIGTRITSMIVFDGPAARVGIQEDAPAFPLDIGVDTRIQTSLQVDTTLGVTGNTTLSKVIVTGNAEDGLNLTAVSSQISFIGAAGEKGITYRDTGDDQRYAMMFPDGSDVVHVLNRAANGTVEIHANTAVAGVGGDVLVAEFQDDIINFLVELNITGANARIDLNPSGTGTQQIIDITPSASLVEGRTWDGVYINVDALDPATGDHCDVHGFHFTALNFASTDFDAQVIGFLTRAGAVDDFTGFQATITELTEDKAQNAFLAFGGAVVLSATAKYRGLYVDYDEITRDGGAPILEGVRIKLPANYANFGTSFAGYFEGDGRSVTLCDTTYALDVSGISRFSDSVTFLDGASITLQESIIFAGATTENIVSFPDDLAVALVFTEAGNSYLTFISTDGSEAVSIAKTLMLSTVINAGVDTDKFLVLDAGGNVDFRTGAEVLADIGGGGGGDVTAADNIVDHSVVRGDGGGKGIQDSGVIIDDADNVTGMVTLTLPNEGLHLLDTGGDHDLIIKPGTDLGADRILTITTGDAARTITLSGNPTLADWFDQAVKQASAPTFDDITVSNPVNIYALSHNAFADYAVGQHRVWEDSIAQDVHADNISEGSVTQHVGAIDHDALLNTHANPYKLDDLAAPDDNTDLDFSTTKHGLVPKGTDVGNFLRDDGTWAVGGGGAATFVALTDTPANYVGAGGKVVVVNAVPDALEFVDSLTLAGLTVNGNILATGSVTASGAGGLVAGSATTTGAVTIWDGTDHHIALIAAPMAGNWGLVLPVADGPANEALATDGGCNLIWRTHDELAGFVAAEHLSLPNTIANVLSDHGAHLVLGATSVTAYRGDRGTVAYNHAVNNNQAHTDYLKNNADDTTSGRITALALTSGAGQINYIHGTIDSIGTYNNTTTGDANMRCLSNGLFKTKTSSFRVKSNITDIEIDSALLYKLRPVSYNSLCEGDDKQRRFVGFIAEEVEKVSPALVDYNAEGRADNYSSSAIMALMLAEIQKQRVEIDVLKAQLNN